VKIWDAAGGQELLNLRGIFRCSQERGPLVPDGNRLASGSFESNCEDMDAVSGEELLTCTGISVKLIVWHLVPDGTRVASGSQDSTVKIWMR